jgi:hypothetical protein
MPGISRSGHNERVRLLAQFLQRSARQNLVDIREAAFAQRSIHDALIVFRASTTSTGSI